MKDIILKLIYIDIIILLWFGIMYYPRVKNKKICDYNTYDKVMLFGTVIPWMLLPILAVVLVIIN